MSDMEARKGKIRRIDHINGYTSFEAILMEIIKNLDAVKSYTDYLEDFEDSAEAFMEVLYETGCEKYKILNHDIYEVIEDTKLDPSGFSEIVENDDGTINYIALWYNGGGSLEEVLEYDMKKDKTLVA